MRIERRCVANACKARNLLLLTCGSYGNVIRWIPPLVVTAAEMDTAVHIFSEALQEAMCVKSEVITLPL
jgi:4-aminobutyrate aminotransferase-like enzyme